MTIIVEDGTGKADSQSYASVADYVAYATLRAITVPDDASISAALIRAADYLESGIPGTFIGTRASTTQAMQWPRTVRDCDGNEQYKGVIPAALIRAQMALATASIDGIELMPNVESTSYVTKETVGPITTEYSDPLKSGAIPTFTAVDALLKGLIDNVYGSIIAVRV